MTKEDLIAKPEPFGHLHDGNGNDPLTFARGPVPFDRSVTCSTVEVFTYSQLQAFAKLIEARTREECAVLCDAFAKGYKAQANGGDNSGASDWKQHAAEEIAAELRDVG